MRSKGQVAGPWLCAAVLALAAALLARWTWLTWPDVLVDFGRELYVAWRLAEGDRLYRDVAYLNGPLSPYWNALVFRALGPSIHALFAANGLVLALATAGLTTLIARVAGWLAATVAGLLFLALFAFAQLVGPGGYNYLAPYSHELTHGTLLWLGAAATAAAHARRPRAATAVGLGALVGLAALTKPEIALATLAAASAGFAAQARRARSLGMAACAAALPVTLAWAGLGHAPWTLALGSGVSALPFYRGSLGIEDLGASLARVGLWALAWGSSFGALAAIAWRVRPGSRRSQTVQAALAFGGCALALGSVTPYIAWSGAISPLPFALVGLVALAWRSLGAAGDDGARARAALLLALGLAALALLLKIALNARIFHYGFALAVPGMALAVAALLRFIPAAITRRGGSGSLFAAGACGLLCAFAGAHLWMMEAHLGAKRFEVGRGADRFFADPLRGRAIAETLAQLERRLGPAERFAVLPEGATFHYWLRRASPSPHVNYMPPELLIFGEDAMRESLERRLPELLLLVHKDTSEYGARFFAVDYARSFAPLIRERYVPIGGVGDTPFESGARFGIQLLRLRATLPHS